MAGTLVAADAVLARPVTAHVRLHFTLIHIYQTGKKFNFVSTRLSWSINTKSRAFNNITFLFLALVLASVPQIDVNL